MKKRRTNGALSKRPPGSDSGWFENVENVQVSLLAGFV